MRLKTAFAALLLLALPPLAVTATAQDTADPNENGAMPRCGPPTDGQVYCKFGVIYECQHTDLNSLDRRTGWRWKADLLRACDTPSPVQSEERVYLPPPEVDCGWQRSDRSSVRGGGGGRGGGGVGPAARSRSPDGTMYIRPDGCDTPER